MNDQERERPAAGSPAESLGSAPAAQQGMGSAPAEQSFGAAPGDGTGSFGSAPDGTQTVGRAPAADRGKNVPLLVGSGLAIVVVLAAIFGFLIK